MALDDIHYQPLTTVAELIRTRSISPVELTQAILARIEQHDGALKSYTTVTADLALSQAKAAETDIGRGLYRGPMHGIPIAVKDLCFTKGIRTTGGMTMYADFKPDHDATVVTKLAQAGAVLLGKLHMTEGATLEPHPDLPEPELTLASLVPGSSRSISVSVRWCLTSNIVSRVSKTWPMVFMNLSM